VRKGREEGEGGREVRNGRDEGIGEEATYWAYQSTDIALILYRCSARRVHALYLRH
jgi:hypothetical protein